VLSLHNVTKRYGQLVAVDDLSLTIDKGEVFGLLGPNGAGKSTTIHLAIGLFPPTAGRVEIAGFGPPTEPRVRATIGVAPQALSIYEELSAEENLIFFGRIYGLAGSTLKRRVGECLEFVQLTAQRRQRVSTYSGGMKRRINLAAALLHEPQLLLFDEPTVGVDPQSRNAIFDSIEVLKSQGRTIVYTTHYMEEAQRLCNRVGIIDHGKLLALDTVDRLITAHGGHSVVTTVTDRGEERCETNDPIAVLTKAQSNGRLVHFSVDRPNLERVFLNLTGRQLRDA